MGWLNNEQFCGQSDSLLFLILNGGGQAIKFLVTLSLYDIDIWIDRSPIFFV